LYSALAVKLITREEGEDQKNTIIWIMVYWN